MTNEIPNEQPVEENRPPEASEEEPVVEQVPPAELEPAEESLQPEAEISKPEGKTFWQLALRWVLIVLVSVAAGFALCFFLLYTPVKDTAALTKIDLADTTSALEAANAKSTQLQTSLTDTTGQLQKTTDQLNTAKIDMYLARLQTNISYARLALVNKDTLTARQELIGAETNLAQLSLALNDSETTSALADRLKSIRLELTGDPSKALDDLRTMSENLDRLANR